MGDSANPSPPLTIIIMIIIIEILSTNIPNLRKQQILNRQSNPILPFMMRMRPTLFIKVS